MNKELLNRSTRTKPYGVSFEDGLTDVSDSCGLLPHAQLEHMIERSRLEEVYGDCQRFGLCKYMRGGL